VFGGMLLASLIGVFFIPVMYVAIQRVRERFRPPAGKTEETPGPVLIAGE
jgi:hypothetical protein